MDPLHLSSTSMVEGDHATTHINRFIEWMVTSTTLMVVWLDGDLTEFTVDATAQERLTVVATDHTDHAHEVAAYRKAARAYRKRRHVHPA